MRITNYRGPSSPLPFIFFIFLLSFIHLAATDILCSKQDECPNKACCHIREDTGDGICGYGPEFCTKMKPNEDFGCVSNCNATAECGKYAKNQGEKCPLNVCCSKWGFCGTAADFCGNDCQSNCFIPKNPPCGRANLMDIRIGYYESWAATRACEAWPPEKIPAEELTHLNYAFAGISDDFDIVLTAKDGGTTDLVERFNDLKREYTHLKTYIAIGGWAFNDPPTQHIFSDMASTSTNRKAFAKNLHAFMRRYGFDGVDLDWEYPGAEDRGGKKEDTKNFVELIKDIRNEFDKSGGGYGITFTIPASYWYLRHFDVSGMIKAGADWANLMSYDLHGTWDRNSTWIGPVMGAHTNLTEIQSALNLLWRDKNIKPEHIVMGFGFYGRSFAAESSSCLTPGCPFSTGAPPGECSNTEGILTWSEIKQILDTGGGQEVYREDAAVNYMIYDDNSWVSYDDRKTFKQKVDYAKELCLGGIMVWAIDQDDKNYSALGNLLGKDIDDGLEGDDDEDIDELKGASGENCYVTDTCGKPDEPPSCRNGFRILDFVHEPLSGSIKVQRPCMKGYFRSICCPIKQMPRNCDWSGCHDGTCKDDQMLLEVEKYSNREGTSVCRKGERRFCCDGDETLQQCHWDPCSKDDQCKDKDKFTSIMSSPLGPDLVQCDDSFEKKSQFCCPKKNPYKNCKWVGPDSDCQSTKCSSGQVRIASRTVAYDNKGDFISCSGMQTMSYCCDAPKKAKKKLPVKPEDIFKKPLGDNDFKFEEDETSNNRDLTHDLDPGDDAFSFVMVDGTEGAVDNSFAESWTVLDQHTMDFKLKKRSWDEVRKLTTEPPKDTFEPLQESYRVVCAAGMSAAECKRIFIMGAENTIIKLPPGVGMGPYARVVSFEHEPDAEIHGIDKRRLHRRSEKILVKRGSAGPLEKPAVFKMTTDFDFAAIKAADKPGAEVQFRSDFSNFVDYWDDTVDEPPDRKRWFGKFGKWMSKVTTMTKSDSGSLTTEYERTWKLFHFEDKCKKGNTEYKAVLDLDAHIHMAMMAQYSYLFQGHLLPTPKTEEAYGYFAVEPFINLYINLQGKGTAQSTTGDKKIVSGLAFPGLSVKGLIRIGPQLDITGRIDTSVQVSGKVEAGFAIQFPRAAVAFPQDSDGKAGSTNPSAIKEGAHKVTSVNPILKAEVEAEGHIEFTATPILSFGIEVLGGKLMKGDVSLGVDNTIDFGVSAGAMGGTNGGSAEFCFWADYIYRVFIQGEISVIGGLYDWGGHYDVAIPEQPLTLAEKKCINYGKEDPTEGMDIPIDPTNNKRAELWARYADPNGLRNPKSLGAVPEGESSSDLSKRDQTTAPEGATKSLFSGLFKCPNKEETDDNEPCSPFGDINKRDIESLDSFHENGTLIRRADPPGCYPLPTLMYNCDHFASYTYNPVNSHPGPHTAIGICENIMNGIKAKSGTTGFYTNAKAAIITYNAGTNSNNRNDACGKGSAGASTDSCSKGNIDKWDNPKKPDDKVKKEARWLSCDEFPFNASEEGGSGASTACVSQTQQFQQGSVQALVANMKYKDKNYNDWSRGTNGRGANGRNGKYKLILHYPGAGGGTPVGEMKSSAPDMKMIIGAMNMWGNPDLDFPVSSKPPKVKKNGLCFVDEDEDATVQNRQSLLWYRKFAGCLIEFKNSKQPITPPDKLPGNQRRWAGTNVDINNPDTWGIEKITIDYDDVFDAEEAMNRLQGFHDEISKSVPSAVNEEPNKRNSHFESRRRSHKDFGPIKA